MTYQHISTKFCARHLPPPAGRWQRVRKWLGRSYRYRQGVWCECPGAVIIVGGTYTADVWSGP